MPAPARSARGFLALVMLASVEPGGKGGGDDPARGACRRARAAPAAPSPAAIAAADTILGDIGIKQTIALVVPGMLTELETNVTEDSA